MKKHIDNILLAALISVIAVGAAAIYYINKSDRSGSGAVSASSNTSMHKHPNVTAYTTLNAPAPDTTNYYQYDMSEPFAENVPFAITPALWMQMMSNMMNAIQMNQMLHQMAAMPENMMNPTMWLNSHALPPNSASGITPQPMDPKEYKKWYEEQQKAFSQ